MLDKSRDPSICHLSVYLIQDNLLSITGKFFYILNIVIMVKTSGFSSSLVSMLQEQASRQTPPLSAKDQKFRGGNSIFRDQHNKEKIFKLCFLLLLITFLKSEK